MASPLKDIAIKCALENKWDQAIEANLEIISENPHDIDTLNRLGFAYLQTSKLDEAQKSYQTVLDLDPTNPIAVKNIKKVKSVSNGSSEYTIRSFELNVNDLYIEEAGKTKTVELKNIADKKTISALQTGEQVHLIVKRSKIFIQNSVKTYIGMLPDNIGMRLTDFIQGGNEYKACIKSVNEKSVVVFIKEMKRVAKFKNQPSFVATPSPLKRRAS
jgi:tetratricopeptide (TPR) repeat protein